MRWCLRPAERFADTPDFAARVKAFAADPHYSNVTVVVEPFSQLTTPCRWIWYGLRKIITTCIIFRDSTLTVFNQMVFEALKPGGIYLVLDHAAEPGTGRPRRRLYIESTRRR